LRHRQWLLAQSDNSGPSSRGLWIGAKGQKMSRRTIHQNITVLTARTFGHPIWPHLFRDCVATSIAIEAPDHVGAIAEILGHTTLATARKYYIQANSLSANREYQRLIRMIRSNQLQMGSEEEDNELKFLRADDFDEGESHDHR
jgi:integrase